MTDTNCITCGYNDWTMTHWAEGIETFDHCSISIDRDGDITLEDYSSSNFDEHNSDDTIYRCHNCDYELNVDDYIGQAIETAVRPALIRPKARTHTLAGGHI